MEGPALDGSRTPITDPICINPACLCHQEDEYNARYQAIATHQNEAEWEKEFERDGKFGSSSIFCGCIEGDMYDVWPDAKKELIAFIKEHFVPRTQIRDIEARAYSSVLDGDAALNYEKGKQDGKAELRTQIAEVVGITTIDDSRKHDTVFMSGFNAALEALKAKLTNPK
jgi:DNA-binding transcriptional MocR family regulator